MNEPIDLSNTKLGDREKKTVLSFCHGIMQSQNHNLKSIIIYGSATRDDYQFGHSDINLLVVLDRIDGLILKEMLDPVTKGRRNGISPFFLTKENLHSSADVFPVKFLSIRESYSLIWGEDHLKELEISREHLRLRCEQEIKNLLLRLRRYYLFEGGRKLDVILNQIYISFIETVRYILSLSSNQTIKREDVIASASETFDFDSKIIQQIKALHNHDLSLSRDEAEKLYDQFITVVDKIAIAIDQMS